MMPGVGFAEMILLALVAIVVIGPKDLPLMMRKFGRFTGKMRALAFEFRQGIDELGRQAELDELRKEVMDLKKHTGIEDLTKEFEQDRINMEKDISSAMSTAEVKRVTSGPSPGAAPAAALGVAAPGAEPPGAPSTLADAPSLNPFEAAAAMAPPVAAERTPAEPVTLVASTPSPPAPPQPSALEALAARQGGGASNGAWPLMPRKPPAPAARPAQSAAETAPAPPVAPDRELDLDLDGYVPERAAKQDTPA